MSHAVYGHPSQMDHGGEFWQNVVHWRMEWHITSVFLPWEPHEQYAKAKDKTLKDGLSSVLLEISGEINPERQRFGRFAEKASNKLKIW